MNGLAGGLIRRGATFGTGIAQTTPLGMGIGAVARMTGTKNPINSLKNAVSGKLESAVSGATPQPNAKDMPTVEAKEVTQKITVSNSVASSTPGEGVPGAESPSIKGLSSSQSKSIGDSLIELGNAASALGKVLVGMKSEEVLGSVGAGTGTGAGAIGSVPGASNTLKSVQGAIGAVPGMNNLKSMFGGYSRKKRRNIKTIKTRKSRKFKYSSNRKR